MHVSWHIAVPGFLYVISGTRPRHLRCCRYCDPRHGVVSEGNRDDLPDVRPAALHTEDCCGGICQARNMLPLVCANTMRPAKGHAGGSRCRLRRPVRGTSELFFGLNWRRPQTNPAGGRQRLGFRNCSASFGRRLLHREANDAGPGRLDGHANIPRHLLTFIRHRQMLKVDAMPPSQKLTA